MPRPQTAAAHRRSRGAAAGRGGNGNALDRTVAFLAGICSALNDPANLTAHLAVACMLLVAETGLCLFIIRHVPYTEIDWVAYMQEVGGYLQGERDYAQLKGGTGPLVYPAGFVYLFAWLQQVTGGSVAAAQVIFAGLYVLTQACVFALYIRAASLPPWSLVLLAASRRLHSIFVLRLFNDCWAMLAAYVATLALQGRRWVLAVVLYSLAVSVKMNVLLMAPGVLAVLVKHARLSDILAGTTLGVALQLALGAPFLAAYPVSYLTRAFEFSRVFIQKWSVNWQFLPEWAFLSRQLAIALLYVHLRLLWSLAQRKWFAPEGGVRPVLFRLLGIAPSSSQPAEPSADAALQERGGRRKSSGGRKAGAGKGSGRDAEAEKEPPPLPMYPSFEDSVLYMVFSANFVGMLAARTIHYQFYSWYFHTLPYLLLRARMPRLLAVLVLAGIEVVYNIYPPHPWASAALLVLHAEVLWATTAYAGACPPGDEVAPVAAGPGTAGEGAGAAAGRKQEQSEARGRGSGGEEEGEEQAEEAEEAAADGGRAARARRGSTYA